MSNTSLSIFIYKPNILTANEIQEIKNWLDSLKFKQGDCPREQLWFQENNRYFSEKWHKRIERWKSCSYPIFLKKIQDKLQKLLIKLDYPEVIKPTFNSCLINKYRNGNDSIKAHRDNTYSFGQNPTIINLSIGAPRYIHLQKNNGKIIKILLQSGSLFIMAGASQREYLHSIPKCDCKKVRYSLTFREYLTHLPTLHTP